MSTAFEMQVAHSAPGDWDAYVKENAASSVYHRSAWIELIQATFGHKVFYIMARDASGGLLGVLPLVQQRSMVFGNFLTSLPFFNYGGPLFTDDAVYQALIGEASTLGGKLRARHVELRTQLVEGHGWRLRDDKVTLIRPLPASAEALGKELGSKLRSQIKRAEREAPVIHKGGAELLSQFYYVFSRNMRDLGTPVYSKQFFRNMLERFPDLCHIVCVEIQGQPAAAGFLVTWNGVTEIPWASCLSEMKPLGANMRLYWECLVEAIARGSSRFDFGRSSVDAGTYRFKLQWGAQPTPMYWHYWLPAGADLPQLHGGNSKMALAISMWKKMPLWLCETLGPHIVRNLP